MKTKTILLATLVIVILFACVPAATSIPPTETTAAATATSTLIPPTPTITPQPDISIDLKNFIYNRNVAYLGETLELDNLQNSEWAGFLVGGPFPIENPFRLKVQITMSGDFAGVTLHGNIKTPETKPLPRIFYGTKGQLGFIDDNTGVQKYIKINVNNDEPFFLDFLDEQGKQFNVVSDAGKILMHIDVTRDIPGIPLRDGLFPNNVFYLGAQAAPKSKLVITQLGLEVKPGGVYSAALDRQCSLTVGDQEVILSNDQLRAAGLRNWPDTVFGTWRDGDKYNFIAANPLDSGNFQYSARTTGTLDNPIAFEVDARVPIREQKHTYGYIGGSTVYRDLQTGTLLMVYDTEKYPPGGAAVHNLDGMAKSTDNGKTWTDLGEILDTEFPGWADWNVGVGNAPFVINGDYFYIYFNDTLISDPRFDIGTSVARAKIADVLNAAINENTVVPWFKYYQGEWNQPGLGGKSTPLELGNPQSTSMFDVSYNDYLNRYIMINGSERGNSYNLYLSESTDGIHWTLRVPIDEGVGYRVYPTIIGLGDDPNNTGSEFYVYYIYTPNWFEADAHGNTVLARRKISCAPSR